MKPSRRSQVPGPEMPAAGNLTPLRGVDALSKGTFWSRSGYRKDDAIAATVLLGPVVLIFLVFYLWPLVHSAALSLSKWGVGRASGFVGLSNYRDLIHDPDFWNSLKVTVIYTVGTAALSLPLGLLAALGLNAKTPLRSLWRSLYFTPTVTATVAAGIVWTRLFDPYDGLVNRFLRSVGIRGPAWLSDPDWALTAVILVGTWKRLGFNALIYLAGLQSIPRELYEAAQVDGAGAWTRLRYITLPLLLPTTWLLLIMCVIDSFQVFDLVHVMTSGGPVGSTEVMGLYLYRQAFGLFHMGYASAIAWVIFLFVFVATLMQWRISGEGGART